VTTLEELANRVDRVESRFEIEELITRYAIACDEHDMQTFKELFTPDAEFDTPSGIMRAKGRDQVVELFVRTLAIRGPGYHWTHDKQIWIDENDFDRATGRVLSHAETSPNGVTSIAAMQYDDDYRRQGSKWRFRKRTLKFLYYTPASEFSAVLSREKRLYHGDAWHAADYPESLESWKLFKKQHQDSGEFD